MSILCTKTKMGICESKEVQEAMSRNREIEKQMKIDEIKARREIKLLLLGAGESGKSTILKQMRIIHDNGFDAEEIEVQKGVIYSNIVQSMAAILRAMGKLKIQLDSPQLETQVKIILIEVEMDTGNPFTAEVSEALTFLWADSGVRACFMRSSEYQLNDSASYFLDEIERISQPDYIPIDQDILRARIKTTGIVEVNFNLRGMLFRVFDVGGQRSERKKWIHLFEDVNAIVFIAAISEYDQVLYEDDITNRMTESLRLFDSICNSRWFVTTSMILFLNKKDLFQQKILRVNITTAFPFYKGGQNYSEASSFIEQQYQSVNQNEDKTIYAHQTCATDTSQVQFVLDSTIDLIVKKNLGANGFL